MAKKIKKRSAVTFKNTFWSKLRVKQNFTIDEVKEYLELQGYKPCYSAIGMYFTGQLEPSKLISDCLCEMFDIDKDEGYLEFQHAHREWKAENDTKKLVSSAKKPYVPKRKKKSAETETTTPSDFGNKNTVTETTPQVIEIVPNNAIINQAIELLMNRKDMVLDIVYGKVDRETYKKIERAFEIKL